jgi:fatty acid desaturase
VLPRSIGYHIEHHWYPSVPFYNLPTLHARLMERAEFRAHAQCSHALLDSLWQCVDRPPIAPPLPRCHSGSER